MLLALVVGLFFTALTLERFVYARLAAVGASILFLCIAQLSLWMAQAAAESQGAASLATFEPPLCGYDSAILYS